MELFADVLVMSPLLFGVWFACWPRSVPWWLVRLPIRALAFVLRVELAIDRTFDADPNASLSTTPLADVDDSPDRLGDRWWIRVMGIALIFFGFLVIFAVRGLGNTLLG